MTVAFIREMVVEWEGDRAMCQECRRLSVQDLATAGCGQGRAFMMGVWHSLVSRLIFRRKVLHSKVRHWRRWISCGCWWDDGGGWLQIFGPWGLTHSQWLSLCSCSHSLRITFWKAFPTLAFSSFPLCRKTAFHGGRFAGVTGVLQGPPYGSYRHQLLS